MMSSRKGAKILCRDFYFDDSICGGSSIDALYYHNNAATIGYRRQGPITVEKVALHLF